MTPRGSIRTGNAVEEQRQEAAVEETNCVCFDEGFGGKRSGGGDDAIQDLQTSWDNATVGGRM